MRTNDEAWLTLQHDVSYPLGAPWPAEAVSIVETFYSAAHRMLDPLWGEW